jgi:uncharacterized protein YjiS (DUF1127 family)
MNTFTNASTPAQHGCGMLGVLGLAARRGLAAFITWRVQQAAIAYLKAMSDRELDHIGLVRSEIEFAVTGERAWR